MADVQHSAQTVSDGIHVIKAYDHANSGARTGTSYASTDVAKVSHQTDNDSFWLVQATTPTFIQLTDDMGGDVTGKQGACTVAKLQGRTVHTSAPTDGQVLTWDNGNSRWAAADSAGGGKRTVLTWMNRVSDASANWVSSDGFGPFADDIWAASFGGHGANESDPTLSLDSYIARMSEIAGTVTAVYLAFYPGSDDTTAPLLFALQRSRHSWGAGTTTDATVVSRTALTHGAATRFYFYATDSSDQTGSARLSINSGSSENVVQVGDVFMPMWGTTNDVANDTRFMCSVVIEE